MRSSLFRAQNADAAGGRGVGLGRSQTSSARMVLALRDWSALAAAPLPVLRIFFVVPRCPPVTGPVRCGKGKGGRQPWKQKQVKVQEVGAHSIPGPKKAKRLSGGSKGGLPVV